MISDGTLALYEKGVINGKYKNFDKEKMTVTFLMGTKNYMTLQIITLQ